MGLPKHAQKITVCYTFISWFENIVCHWLIALHSHAVSAINGLYVALGSPKLPGWSASGGDPCGESWQGVTFTGSSITSMYASYSICYLLPIRLFHFVLLSTNCLQNFQCCKFGWTARQPGELHFNNWNVRARSSQFSLPMVMAVFLRKNGNGCTNSIVLFKQVNRGYFIYWYKCYLYLNMSSSFVIVCFLVIVEILATTISVEAYRKIYLSHCRICMWLCLRLKFSLVLVRWWDILFLATAAFSQITN